MTIGERIKIRREELGLTQDELAKKCGYKSRSSINKIELSRELPLRKVSIMAEALECSPGYLMGWGDNEKDVLQNKIMVLSSRLDADRNNEIEEALKFYEKYKHAIPEIQDAVARLLKSGEQDS